MPKVLKQRKNKKGHKTKFKPLLITVAAILLIAVSAILMHRTVSKKQSIVKAKRPVIKVVSPIRVKPAVKANLPKLAIIIDDVGYDNKTLGSFIKLNLPLTYAILPNATYYKDSIAILKKRHIGYMLHMPMQPHDYPKINPGKNALLLSMGNSEIKHLTEAAIEKVAGAIGVNNHMGSAFVQNKPKMIAFLSVLEKHNLFFVDSETTNKTVGWKIAKYDGMKYARRNIFLDDMNNVNYIKRQIFKAVEFAKRHGQAIAIGHDKPATVKALAETKNEINGVRLVLVKTLVK